ncbi:hypothetical protein MTO96_028570 [Rhipicephalus appendiculatus]
MLPLRSDDEGASHPTSIKEKAEATPQLPSGQGATVSNATKTQGLQSGAKLADFDNAKTSATPSRKSSGLNVKVSVAESTNQSPKRTTALRSSAREVLEEI